MAAHTRIVFSFSAPVGLPLYPMKRKTKVKTGTAANGATMAPLSMNSDRWKQTEELFHGASALSSDDRSAFLREACQGDEALRQEVESLIAARPGGFLDGPGLVMPADLDLSQLIGVDGWPDAWRLRVAGAVRRRRDGRGLSRARSQARARCGDQDSRARIYQRCQPPGSTRPHEKRECWRRSTIPTFVRSHGSEEINGVRFLILELVDGNTLSRLLASRPDPLPLQEALTFANGIADALEAAHEKGIVHRDLKPANIKITAEGYGQGPGLWPRQDRRSHPRRFRPQRGCGGD